MGAEAQCIVRYDKHVSAGKALLETDEIIFRGEFRLKIAFKDIRVLAVTGGELAVTFSGGTATFEMGAAAEKWAAKIRNPKSRIDKLGIRPADRVVVLGVCDDAFVAELRARAAFVSSGRVVKDADAIFLGAETIDGLARMPRLAASMKRDGGIWTITPKGKGGIKDTDIMELAKSAGLVALKVVAFSPTHSANKFVIPKAKR